MEQTGECVKSLTMLGKKTPNCEEAHHALSMAVLAAKIMQGESQNERDTIWYAAGHHLYHVFLLTLSYL